MEEQQKFNVELKQTMKGVWYVGSLKINTNDIPELSRLIDSTVPVLQDKIDQLNKDDFKPASSPPLIILNGDENILFEKLKRMRMDLARAENIPAYVVMHDSTLKHIAKSKPMTNEDLLKVEGMGEKKLDKYGVYFLKVIQNHCQSH